MEKVKNYILAMAVVAIAVIGGCTKAPVQPTNSRESASNNLVDNNTTVTVQYTVRVVPRHERGGKVAGLAGAKVIVSQGNGTDRQEVTTNADGHANFNVKLGAIEVYVEAGPAYARVNVAATATRVGDYVNSDEKNHVEQGNATTVILPTLNAGIKGRAHLSDPAGEKKFAPKVTAVFELTNKSVQPNQFTVQADDNGLFEFTKLPDGEAGTLRIDSMSTFGAQNVNANYALYTFTTNTSGTSGTYTDLGAVSLTAVNHIYTGTLVGRIVKPADPAAVATLFYTNAANAGSAAPNVKVKLTYTGLTVPFQNVYETTTGADGKFTFTNVPATDGSNTGVTAKLSASVIYTTTVNPMNLPSITLDIEMKLSNNLVGVMIAVQDPFPTMGTILVRKGGTTNAINGVDFLLTK